MHASPTSRTEDFRHYGFIYMNMGHPGLGSHVHERSGARGRPRAGASVQSRMTGGERRGESDGERRWGRTGEIWYAFVHKSIS